MELTPYLDGLQRDLAAAAAPGGPDIQSAAQMLSGSLEASARLCLLEALSDAAAEITTRLDGGSVDVRLRGREAQFVVTPPQPTAEEPPPARTGPPTAAPEPESGDIARITLRLPESLKDAVERAASAEGVSVNAWLVRAVAFTVAGPPGPPPMPPPPHPGPHGRLGRRVTGFAQA